MELFSLLLSLFSLLLSLAALGVILHGEWKVKRLMKKLEEFNRDQD